jgi:pimeloyl-ACP methyl ester carboxylesterase
MARRSKIVGSYLYLPVDGVEYRVYYEEAGSGIPLVLQHTASADNRQWRHLLEDEDVTRHFRVIAHDLPLHGKSLPPESERWWEREYRLTKDFFETFVLELCAALELERPVFMGCSMGGHLAIDLAIDHPGAFRAVIGLEAGLQTRGTAPPRLQEWFFHPRLSNDFKPALMYTMMGPASPERYRRETTFVYSQGAPAVFKGDLYYYGIEHDVTETARSIDTSRTAVYVLGGEYDWSGRPEVCRALAGEIAGSYYRELEGLGHFPMCEHPERFKEYLLPVLDQIRAASSEAG